MNRSSSSRRGGITLLEVVLSLALAAIAIALLTQLVSIGNRAATVARNSAKAQLIAASIMAEIMAGIIPPQTTSGVYEQDPMWSYDVVVGIGATQTINIIGVSVTQNIDTSKPMTFSLTQWQALPPEPEEEVTDDTSGASI